MNYFEVSVTKIMTKSCVFAWRLPYPMTTITKAIMTQTMIPARKRRRTMKSRLVSIAITNPLQRVHGEMGVGVGGRRRCVRGETS